MADMEYTVDLNDAIQAFNDLNQAINQVSASGRSSKKKLQPVIDEIEGLKAVLKGTPAEIDAIVASLKNIALNPTTMKASLRELTTALDAAAKNMKRGTAAMVAVKNQETFSLKRELDRQVELQQRATAKIEAALNKEDRLRRLKGLKPLRPDLKYSDPEERAAVQEGVIRREEAAIEAWHTKQRALEDKATTNYEKELLQREAAQRRFLEQGAREARSFDTFNAGDKQLESDAKSKFDKFVAAAKTQGEELQRLNLRRFNQNLDTASKEHRAQLELNAAAIDERIKQTQEGEKRTQDLLNDSAEINAARIEAAINLERKFLALAAKQRAKHEQKIIANSKDSEEENTKAFKKEVDKRIAAAKSFDDARRAGLTKSQFDSLKGDKLSEFEIGARISRGLPQDKIDAAAIKQLSDNYRLARSSQAEVIEGAKRLGIPLRENVEKAKEFTLSWKAMGRIVVAQAFTQAFFAMQNELRQSTTEAVELYKAIAQIQTIVTDSSRGITNYAAALATIVETSSSINFTPQDTANAFYETLSNQIGDSVSQIREFVVQAGNLAKVTRSTLADSADAITAVMNAYGKGASSAEEISALLFATVDKGRVKLDAIANHMGNVAVPAAQLGIEFGKVAQALSALTIAGITESEAMTLQRNVMFQLIKPTEDMVNLFHEWGVSSGQSAIAAFGFSGVVEKLAIEAEKGNERIAELFGTIRGVRGIQGLIGSSFEKLNETFEDGQSAIAAYKSSVDDYIKNSGEKFSKLQQEISNQFLLMGLRVVELTVAFNDWIGTNKEGASSLAKTIGVLSKVALIVAGAGTAFLVTAAALGAIVTATAAFVFTLGTVIAPVTIAIAAIAALAGVATGTAIGIAAFTKSSTQRFGELKAQVEKMNEGISDSFEEGIIKSLRDSDDIARESKTTLAGLANVIAELNAEVKNKEAKKTLDDLAAGLDNLIKAFGGNDAAQKLIHIFKTAGDLKALYENMVGYTNDYLSDTISGHEKEADSIQQVIDKLEDQRKKLSDIAKENRNSLAEKIAERNINALPQNQRGTAQYQAAQAAAQAGANAVDIEEAERLFDIANRFLADAERTAFESGTFGTLQNHTRFFNEQQASLVALEEKRLYLEDQRLASIQANNAEVKKGYTDEVAIFQKELDRRKEKQTQFEIEKEFLQEYIRLRDQILKSEDLSTEVQVERLDILSKQARLGLDAINASDPTRKAFEKELDKNSELNQTRVLLAQEEAYAKKQKELVDATEKTKSAVSEYGQTLESSISAIETAAKTLLSQLPEDFDPNAQQFTPYGTTTGLVPNKEGVALINELVALKEAIRNNAIDPQKAYEQIKSIAARTEELRSRNSISNRNISDSVDAGVKGLEGADAERKLAITLVEQTKNLEQEFSKLTQALQSEIASREETLAEAYDRRIREQGNAGSSEGESEVDNATFSDFVSKGIDRLVDNFNSVLGLVLKQNSTKFTASEWLKISSQSVPIATSAVSGAQTVSRDLEMLSNKDVWAEEISNGIDIWRGRIQLANEAIEFVVDLGRAAKDSAKFITSVGQASGNPYAYMQAQAPVQVLQQQQNNYSLRSDRNIFAEQEQAAQESFAQTQQEFYQEQRDAYQTALADEAFFGGEISDSLAQIAADTIAAEEAAAEKAKRNTINGVPMQPNTRDNYINGVPMPEGNIYPDNYINGKPYIDDGVNNSASWAAEIPPAIEQGSQAIPEAMRQGSYSVRQAVVDGMAEAFRRNQMNSREGELQRVFPGPNRFAMGGPVGTDTIPAWLSPGEFVVRAQAVRKNFDVLQAINAGTYQRFSNGGSVSNSQSFSNVFNMKTTNPQMQAAQMITIMKRQISQGKATLGKGRPY